MGAGIIFILTVCVLILHGKRPAIIVNGDKIYEDEFTFLSKVSIGTDHRDLTDSERVVRAKIEQQYLKENGFVDHITYSSFRNKLKEENNKRQQALKSGGKVYGPQQFDMFVYYDYYYSEARDRMISGIMENQITDQEVAEYCICLGYTGEPGEDEKNMAKYNIALQRYWFNIEQMISDAVVKK